jgi:hypothetical protein
VTVAEALSTILRVGTVENQAGNLRLRFPETATSELQPAIDTLRAGKVEALALLSDSDPAELAHASAVLNRAGVRIIALGGRTMIGLWSDLDRPEVRAALRGLGSERLPVRYLDAPGVPLRYKVRRVEGDPVPTTVLAEMKLAEDSPWSVRDRLLKEIAWCAKGLSWSAWKAASMKRLFQAQGTAAAVVSI